MTAVASRDILSAGVSSGEISLLKEAVLIAVGVDRQSIPAPLRNAVRVVWFEGLQGDNALFSDADGGVFSVQEVPLLPLAILVETASSGSERRLQVWLQRHGMPVQPPVLEWSPERAIEVLALLVRRGADSLAAGARRLVLVNRELRQLRSLNDDLQNRFAAVESYLSRRGLQPFDLAFANDPVADPAQPNVLAAASAEGICQILPVASTGVSGIAIHFERLPQGSASRLRAQLVTLEDLSIVDSWLVPADDLVTGWNILGLTQTLAGLRRTLEIRIRLEDGDEDTPLLSVGGMQPIDQFQIRDAATNTPLMKNSLAMQVWCGMPGVSLPSWTNYLSPVSRQPGTEGGFQDLPIAPGILELATLANTSEVEFDFPAIMPLPGERAIGCHPPNTGLTIGRLPAACPPQAVRLSANAFISNDQAKDIDFAIVIAGDLAEARELFEERREPGTGEGFSGWTRVAYGDTAHISAFIADQVSVWRDIYFATRMAVPGDNSFAWAKFGDLSVLVNG